MSWIRQSILLLACIVLCSAAFFSLRNTIASFLALPVDNLLNDTRFYERQQDVSVLEKSSAQLEKAIILNSALPDYWQWQGRLATLTYLVRSQAGEVPDPSLLQLALTNFRAVIREKSLWSYAYLDLAYTKFLLGVIDDEFYGAFQQVFAQGQESYRVCRTLSLMGLRLWKPLRSEYRDMVRQSFLTTYQQDRWSAMLMARDADQVGVACLWVREEPKKHPLCERPSSKWW